MGLDEAGAVGGAAAGSGTAPIARQHATADVDVTLEEGSRGTARLVEVGGKRLEVTIPPGVSDGQRIRLSGKAGSGPTPERLPAHPRRAAPGLHAQGRRPAP